MTSNSAPQNTITALLHGGLTDEALMERLFPLVYDELRGMARGYMQRERNALTINATGLVHEAYLKLMDQTWTPAKSRAYFFGAAARAMRRILVDHARHRMRHKRGGGERPITLDEQHQIADEFASDVLDLDAALGRMAQIEPRAARVVECRFFGGLDVAETAEVLGVSTRTVKRDWIMAKAWLYRVLHGQSGSDDVA